MSDDCDGRPIPADEAPDTVIGVWCIEPHRDSAFDTCMVRSWHEVTRTIAEIAEGHLDSMAGTGKPTAAEPFIIKVWLEKMTVQAYEEIVDGEPY